MKRLFLFFLILGAFFCFNKANAGSEMIFYPVPTTSISTCYSGCTYGAINTTLQNFQIEKTGILRWFELKGSLFIPAVHQVWGNYVQIKDKDGNVICNTWYWLSAPDYLQRCEVNTDQVYVAGDNFSVYLNTYGWTTRKLNFYVQAPSTTYLNSDGHDTFYNSNNYDLWIKYGLDPFEQHFYIIDPPNNPSIEYNMLYNLSFQCYTSSSRYAIYQNDDYLLATTTDFCSCNDPSCGGSDTGLVNWFFTAKDEWNTLTILDENYLSSPVSAYKIDREYFGKMYGTFDIMASVLYPDMDPDTALYYTVTTTSGTPEGIINGFRIGVISNLSYLKPENSNALYLVYTLTSTYQWLSPEQEYGEPTKNGWNLVDAINGSSLVKNNKFGTWDFVTNIETYDGIYSHYRITRIASDESYNGEIELLSFTAVPWSAGFDTNGSSFFKNVYTTTTLEEEDGLPFGITWCENVCGITTIDKEKMQKDSYWSSLTNLKYLSKSACTSICNLVYPTKFIKGEIGSYEKLTETLTTYPPFGYFFVYQDYLTLSMTSTATTTSGWEELADIWLVEQIRKIWGWILYIIFGVFIYKLFFKMI